MSNIKKWDNWYENLKEIPSEWGNTPTFYLASEFLKDCLTVEDWGCGSGVFSKFCKNAIGIDGSNSPFATKKFIDLTEYISDVEGIHLRHVLEHNYEWQKILNNILKSARKKIVITMFIPFGDKTQEIRHNKNIGVDVPSLLISKKEFTDIVEKYKPQKIEHKIFDTQTEYKKEEMVYITI
jgi:hypothetical protein